MLRGARIIGATCTKTYLSHGDIGRVNLVIIDEASMVTSPMAWFSAGLAREQVVISGDFRQLWPIVQTEQEAIFEELGRSPFTATGRTKPGAPSLARLGKQYRMCREICEIINGPMYDGELSTVARETVSNCSPPRPFEGPLTIIDTSKLGPFASRDAFFSRFNVLHALLARNLAWHFQKSDMIKDIRDFGICTPYSAQARLIQKLLGEMRLNHLVYSSTVHRFQGDERRIMLLEIPESPSGARWGLGKFVQGEPPEHSGARLLNVAGSRAQEHLVVLANLNVS